MTRFLLVLLAQSVIWIAAAWGFLLFMVDSGGHYVHIPLAITYVVISFAAIFMVPFFAANGSCFPKAKSRIAYASLSPGILLFELLVISGNITPWVLAEPLMWTNIGNIATTPQPADGPTVQVPIAISKVSKDFENPDVIHLDTVRGSTEIMLNEVKNPVAAVIEVGGVGGGFDSPGDGLYAKLGKALSLDRILVLDVKLRKPNDTEESLYDVRVAVNYLQSIGVRNIILMGHSFGGGLVLRIAHEFPEVTGVIALSSQTTGSEHVEALSPKFVGLIHGVYDYVNPRFCSQDIYRRAREPKTVRFLVAGHPLDEAGDEILKTTLLWIHHLSK